MTDDEFKYRFQLPVQRKAGTEIAPGIWTDPLSERRNDFDGSQAGFEAALAQAKSIVDAISGGAGAIDTVWDAALDIAAHIAETQYSNGAYSPEMQRAGREIARSIRTMKKER